MEKRADLKNAKWIEFNKSFESVTVRKTFFCDRETKGKLTIACLGIFEVYINGEKVSDDLFLPLSTDFHERKGIIYEELPFEEKLGHRIYCPVYDVSLSKGENVLAFMIGCGWYQTDFCGYGNMKLRFILETDDGEKIISDESVKYSQGYVKKCSLITGETQDFAGYDDNCLSIGCNDDMWAAAAETEISETELYVQDCPADRVIRKIYPKLIAADGGKRIYDLGENITGYPIIEGKSDFLRLRYGERLDSAGKLREENIYDQHTEFIGGAGRLLHSKFTWHCFRYFEIEGEADVKECDVIHADVKVTSDFKSDSEILNWLYSTYIRTQLDNLHCGLTSDCPHTERRGYTGDGQLVCAAAMMQLGVKKLFKKWIYDISDCQDRETGHVQYTAPFITSGGGPGGWGCAIVNVPYQYYKQYKDKEILRELYPQMIKWFSFMENHSEDGLVVSDRENAWCLGDWCTPDQAKISDISVPPPLVNTYFYIRSMKQVIEIEKILGINENTDMLKERINKKFAALTEKYFDAFTGDFAGNTEGANAFAVDLGLGDGRTFKNMVDHYKKIGHYDTGIFGTDIVTKVLFENGEAQTAFKLLTSRHEVSFYSQMMSGATTLQEYWTGQRSQCHPMFGAVTRYLFEYILGIKQAEGSAGYDEIVISPQLLGMVRKCSGKIETPHGIVSVEYCSGKIVINIPENTRAYFEDECGKILLGTGENIICY